METKNSIFLTLSKIARIKTSKVSMYSLDDLYAHPPFLRFRFDLIDKSDKCYKILEDIITDFKGSLKWCLTTKVGTENFIIIPAVFLNYLEKDFYNRKLYDEEFSPNEYKLLVEKSIADIPFLANHISKEYAEKTDNDLKID